MKIVLISVICGILITLNEAYDIVGKNLSLLESKVISTIDWSSRRSWKPFMVSIRKYQKHICTGFIIGGRTLMSTGDCVTKIKYSYMKLDENLKPIVEIYYGAYRNRMQFKVLLVNEVEVHKDYKFNDPKKSKKFSKHNIGIIYVKTPFDGQYAINVRVSLIAAYSLEKEKFFVIGWDSSISKKQVDDCPQATDVKIVNARVLNNQLCEQIYATQRYQLNSHDGLKCLKVIDGNLHEGDIGSPVFHNTPVIGIIVHVSDYSLNLPVIMITWMNAAQRLPIPSEVPFLEYDTSDDEDFGEENK